MPSRFPERETPEITASAPLARALDAGLLLLGAGGEPVFASPAARELLAAPEEAGLAARLAALEPALEAHLLAPARRGGTAEGTFDLAAGDGGVRRLRIAAFALPQAGRGTGAPALALLLRDAGALAGAEEDLRLAAHMRAVAAITPLVAHDLRGPINSMVFNLEVLKETLGGAPAGAAAEAKVRERQARYVRVLGEELTRLHGSLEVWLAQTAERTQEVEDCDLRELLGELAALLVPPARKRQVKVAWEPPDGPVVVAARRAALKQALLLSGLAVLEECASGTSIALGVATGSGRTLVTLTGGPSPGLRESRFHLQDTPQASRNGLHVARLLVEESGGRLRAAGEPERPDGLELEWLQPSQLRSP